MKEINTSISLLNVSTTNNLPTTVLNYLLLTSEEKTHKSIKYKKLLTFDKSFQTSESVDKSALIRRARGEHWRPAGERLDAPRGRTPRGAR